jgi:eukaryotic-like serine/threonine-protein kinase
MAADLRDQVQRAVGVAYTVERELGGGGMSRVFVATETALARKVVIEMLLDLILVSLRSDPRFAELTRRAHLPQ